MIRRSWTAVSDIYSPVFLTAAASLRKKEINSSSTRRRATMARGHLRGGLFILGGNFAIKRFVSFGSGCPRKISGHRTLHQFSPQFAIPECISSPFDRVPKGFGGIFVAKKTIAVIIPGIVIFDDFLNSAGRLRDWKGAVFQTIHRAQSGRLEP